MKAFDNILAVIHVERTVLRSNWIFTVCTVTVTVTVRTHVRYITEICVWKIILNNFAAHYLGKNITFLFINNIINSFVCRKNQNTLTITSPKVNNLSLYYYNIYKNMYLLKWRNNLFNLFQYYFWWNLCLLMFVFNY